MIDNPRTIIVGTGALGTAIARRMKAVGCPVTGILSRTQANADALANEVGSPYALTYEQRLAEAIPEPLDFMLLCVPDGVIGTVMRLLAKTNAGSLASIIAHTSGVLCADVLKPLPAKGVAIMSFHPMQTFTNHTVSSFDGIYFGIEGKPEAVAFGFDFAKKLGGIPIVVPSEAKTRYHLAASIASNLFVSLTSIACDVLSSAGIDNQEAIKVLYPLIHQTSQNMAAHGPEKVLSGPGARGDVHTINLHDEALKKHFPAYRSTYLSLVKETINIASRTGRLTPEKTHQILQKLDKTGLQSED